MTGSMSSPSKLDLIRRLEEAAWRGWPALETRDIGSWRLRFAGGYTKRANSINALSQDARVEPQVMAELEAPYRTLGQSPVWRLTPLAPAAIGESLGQRGYRSIERSLVQLRPLEGADQRHPDVAIHPHPTAAWIEAFCRYSPVRLELREIMERMLRAIAAPKGFAFVERAGQPLAMAIGAVDGECMGLFDVLVMPDARRQGWAQRVTESLYAWAYGQGARFAYLQVVDTNAAARPLYEAQGFLTIYQYEYRVPSSP
jgi:GNAT superfamily N-acetyltransferase